MSNEYTPTTEEFERHLRDKHIGGWSPVSIPGRNANAEFDRWLAQVQAEAAARALEEAADAWHAEHAGTRPIVYQWLRARAAAIRTPDPVSHVSEEER